MEGIGLMKTEHRLSEAKKLFLLEKRSYIYRKGIHETARQLKFFSEIFWLFAFYDYDPEFKIKEPGRFTAEGDAFHVMKQGRERERREKLSEFRRSGVASIDFGLLELSVQKKKKLFPECGNVVYLFDFSFVVTFRCSLEDRDMLSFVCKLGERFGFSLEFLEGFSFLLVKKGRIL